MRTRPLADLRLLVVEDDEMVRRVVVRAAADLGAVVDTAENGQVALERLREGCYDVVLTDLKMPRVSGLDVLRRARESRPGTGLIVITGYAQPDDEDAIRKAGAIVLRKPFGTAELEKAVRAVCAPRSDD